MKIKKIVPLVNTVQDLAEIKAFYQQHFGFELTFESEGFIGLRAAGAAGPEIDFMQVAHSGEPAYSGGGVTLCLEVENVDAEHDRLQAARIAVDRPLQDNPWGDRSFVVTDPAGVSIYIYHLITPSPEFAGSFKD